MKTIVVYRKQLLRISETFIKTQVLGYRRYRAVLFGENYVSPRLDLAGVPHKVFLGEDAPARRRIAAKIRQRLGIVPRAVRETLRAEHPALLHAHTGFDGVIAWPYARTLGIPMVVTLHGQCTTTRKSEFLRGGLGFWNRFYPFLLLRMARDPRVHFIAVSEVTRRTAIEFGLPPERIRVLYSGLDVDGFPQSPVPMAERPKRVAFVARLIEFKGCNYLIDAFRKVLETVPDAELTIIGDGPLRAELEAQAAPCGASVRFLGAQGREEIVRTLSSSRVFCLPSVTTAAGNYETFGVVAIEAQAVGVPVVTSARGAKESVVDGVTGFHFEEREVERLAALLIQLLENPAQAAEMGAAAARHVRERFDVGRCNALVEAYYDEILGGS